MRRLKDLYPEYADSVDFYAVGTFSKRIESLETLENYRQRQEHPWPVANPADAAVLQNLGVTVQSTKIAFDRNGVITYRDGFGSGNLQTWRQVFDQLAQPQ